VLFGTFPSEQRQENFEHAEDGVRAVIRRPPGLGLVSGVGGTSQAVTSLRCRRIAMYGRSVVRASQAPLI